MPPRLLIRLLPDDSAEWLALARDGRALNRPHAGWPDAPGEENWVIVPGEDVLLLEIARIARQRRQLLRAAPFALEDQLAGAVEAQHVALEAREQGERLTAAVVTRARLDRWLERLRAAGIEPDRLVPDTWLLPAASGSAALWCEHGRALLRTGAATAFAGRVDDVPDWFAVLGDAGALPAEVHAWGELPRLPDSLRLVRERADAGLIWFAQRLGEAAELNLLQGEYAPRRVRAGARRLWIWAAALAGVALLAGIGQAALERRQLLLREAAARAEMESLLRDAVPGLTRIVDPRAQLAAEHARLTRGGTGALPLLAQIAPALAGSGRYTVDGLEYRGDTLELIVRTSDVAALDSLREILARLPGLRVEVAGLTPGSGGVEGRLVIRGSAS